jgi:hypothetical protein
MVPCKPHGWVQSFSELLRCLWWKCTTSTECKTNRLAMLPVKSGLDPHMTKLWNLNVKLLFYLYLWCLYFINWVGMNLQFFSNYVANKNWLTKMLNCLKLSHPPYGLACYVVSLAEYITCSRLFIFLYLQYSNCCSDWENFEDYLGDF